MHDVDQILQEAYSKVRSGQAERTTKLVAESTKQKVTPVTSASAKTEKKRKNPKGVKDPKQGPSESATDGDTKNVKNLIGEGEEAPETKVADAEEEKPLLVNEEESTSAFDKLYNTIIDSDDEDLVKENMDEGYPEEEMPPEEMPPEEAAPTTVTVDVAVLEEILSLVNGLIGGGAGGEEVLEEPVEVPVGDEDDIPQESKAYNVGGVVGKKPHPLTGADDRQTTSTKAGDPKAKKNGGKKNFAPEAKLKGADKTGGGHVKVANRKKPGDPLFAC